MSLYTNSLLPFHTMELFYCGRTAWRGKDVACWQLIWLWADFCHEERPGSTSTFQPGA